MLPIAGALIFCGHQCFAFVPLQLTAYPRQFHGSNLIGTTSSIFAPQEISLLVLDATGGGKKRKRRRRKSQPPGSSSAPDQVKSPQPKGKVEGIEETEEEPEDENIEQVSAEELYQIQDVAKFEFETDSAISMGKYFML